MTFDGEKKPASKGGKYWNSKLNTSKWRDAATVSVFKKAQQSMTQGTSCCSHFIPYSIGSNGRNN